MDIDKIKNVTVAGCGTQGSQIASQIAYKGFNVTVWVRSEASVGRAKPRLAAIREQYQAALEGWKKDPAQYCRGLSDDKDLTEQEIDELEKKGLAGIDSIRLETDYDKAFSDADIVVECINENPDEKRAFYKELAKHLPEKTILLTDSSTFMPSNFMEDTGRPEKYMTLHFANQIWKNNLAEVMKTSKTSDDVFELVQKFAKKMGMVPLKLYKEQPGYILNTILIPWFKAALYLAATGVSDPETIDLTWVLDTGADPGQAPFRKLDKIGLVLAYKIFVMDPEANKPGTVMNQIANYLKKYIDEGKTGIAVGEGFYKYQNYDK